MPPTLICPKEASNEYGEWGNLSLANSIAPNNQHLWAVKRHSPPSPPSHRFLTNAPTLSIDDHFSHSAVGKRVTTVWLFFSLKECTPIWCLIKKSSQVISPSGAPSHPDYEHYLAAEVEPRLVRHLKNSPRSVSSHVSLFILSLRTPLEMALG